MEGNRDEAEKCIGIAREALEAGNRDRALRFLNKAQKLYPTETARGEARPPPRSRCPAPSGRARTDRGARRRAGAGGPAPGGPCGPRRAAASPRGSPGALAGCAARLAEEAGVCAREQRSGQVPSPSGA